jgi:hypothetical protein
MAHSGITSRPMLPMQSSHQCCRAGAAPGGARGSLHPPCQFTSLPPPSPPARIPAAPPHEQARGQAGGATGDHARPECRATRRPWPPGGLLSSALPSSIPAARPTSGPAGRQAGPAAIHARPECRRRAGLRPPLAGCLHPGCQAESLLPPSPPILHPCRPLTSGQRAGGRGQRPSTLDRNAGRRAIPALWRASPHPRCQAASLPPPHERARGQAGGASGLGVMINIRTLPNSSYHSKPRTPPGPLCLFLQLASLPASPRPDHLAHKTRRYII